MMNQSGNLDDDLIIDIASRMKGKERGIRWACEVNNRRGYDVLGRPKVVVDAIYYPGVRVDVRTERARNGEDGGWVDMFRYRGFGDPWFR